MKCVSEVYCRDFLEGKKLNGNSKIHQVKKKLLQDEHECYIKRRYQVN